jgi:hypothetical protein
VGADADPPETLKVQQGAKTFEMTEPGSDGHLDIKVGDGTGQPKDYQLDWSTAQDPASGGAGHGPQGTDDVYHAGPDGKIHVQDGDLKITAERPDGPDGPTKVTVDDGSGTPTTYTLGDADTPVHGAAPLAPNPSGDPTAAKFDGAAGAGVPSGNGAMDNHVAAGTAPNGVDGAPAHGGTSDTRALSHQATAGGVAAGNGGAPPATGGVLGGGAHSGAAGFAVQNAPGSPQLVPASGATGQSLTGMSGMGAMGGGGGGGAGGGDQERGTRAYRIEGGLFEFGTEPSNRITGSLDDEELPPAPRRR